MGDLVTSLIRTYTPLIVGFAVSAGLLPDTMSDQATLALSGVVSGVFYAVVRLAEKKWPAAGWLLGAAKKPTYS